MDNSIRLANWLNLLVASSALLVGIYYFYRSSLLKEHRFLKGVLAFWLGQWFVFVITWIRIITTYPAKNDYLTLALSDLQSLVAIGFAVAFLFGEELKDRWRSILKGLALAYILLILINVLASVGVFLGGPKGGISFFGFFLIQWQSTGQVLSLIADCLLGLSFVMRYGKLGLYMLAACVFYATLQSPIYGVLFGPSGGEELYVKLALAFGKAFLAAVFYWLFFERAVGYGRIGIPLQPAPKFDWKALVRRGVVFLVLAISVAAVTAASLRGIQLRSLAPQLASMLPKMIGVPGLLILILRWLSPKSVWVHFVVNDAAATDAGDSIYLTGNCRELGDWWPGEARAVSMDGTSAPRWVADVHLPAKKEIQFKFIKIAAKALSWENGNNHAYTVPNESGGPVNCKWQR